MNPQKIHQETADAGAISRNFATHQKAGAPDDPGQEVTKLLLTNLDFLFKKQMAAPICFAGIIIVRRLGKGSALHAAVSVVVSAELLGREWLFDWNSIRLFLPRLFHRGDSDGARKFFRPLVQGIVESRGLLF